jgi:hypothetical protein
MYETYMTEMQLRRTVDRNAQEGSEQQSDGMVKDGENISKFSKEAMTLGDDVYAYEGNAPAILLQKVAMILAAGNKYKCVKAMDWTGKTASAQVIRGFVRSTPVVEGCALPLCISRFPAAEPTETLAKIGPI